MRKIILLVAMFLLFMSCGRKSKEVALSLTNPQDLAVAFFGYYVYVSRGDSVRLSGSTPYGYQITLEPDEAISGYVHKEGLNTVDTLHFQIFVDDVEQLSEKTTAPSEVIDFYVSGE